MADQNDALFAGLDTLDKDPLFQGLENKALVRSTPISDTERMIVQNLFDTQPKRRAAYLKQIGFEMNPKDDNQVRPIGSSISWDSAAEIDPGIKAYFKPGGLKEVWKDATDIGWDSLLQMSMAGAGATAGASAGGVAGSVVPGVGNAIGGVLGGVLGGAAGNAASETLKKAAGDLVLDESVPADMKLMAVQSMVVGAMPAITKGVMKGGAAVWQKAIDSQKEAIVNAAKSAGGGLTPELLDKASKNPEMFTKEAVDGATERLHETYKMLFGVSPDEPITIKSTRQINPDSAFGKVLAPLNEQAKSEVDKLAANPAANFTVGELKAPLQREIGALSSKFDRSAEENAALKYLREKAGMLDEKGAERLSEKVSSADNAIVDFKEGREFLKAIQSDAFDREVPGSSYLKAAVGGRPDAIRAIADAKAKAAGSNLPEINAQRSDILAKFQTGREFLKPAQLTRAFIGDATDAKLDTQKALANVDSVLGTSMTKMVEDGSMQRVVENAYKNNKPFASGRVTQEALSGFASGARDFGAAGAVLGAPFGMGIPAAAVGGIGGGVYRASQRATLASPEKALTKLGDLSSRSDQLNEFISKALTPAQSAVNQVGGAALGSAVNQATLPDMEEDPLFKGLE